VDPFKVIATGATQIRTAFPPDQVPHIIDAYMAGLKVVFAITVAIVGLTVPFSLMINRTNLHAIGAKKSEDQPDNTV